MIPPESVEEFKKNYILHDLHLHDSEGMFYGFWSTLRRRSRRICSVEWRSHGRQSPRFACLLALFTLAHIACLLHICVQINKFALLYLGPRPNNNDDMIRGLNTSVDFGVQGCLPFDRKIRLECEKHNGKRFTNLAQKCHIRYGLNLKKGRICVA